MNKLTFQIVAVLMPALFALSRLEGQPLTFERTYASSSLMRPCKVFVVPGGYAVAGAYSSGTSDYFLSFFDLEGSLLHTGIVGTPASPDWFGDCIRTADGGFVIAGSTFMIPENPEGESTLLVRTDSSGNLLWMRTYTHNPGNPPYVFERGKSVAQAADGGFVVASTYSHSIARFPGILDNDILIRKIDAGGNELQTVLYGDSLGEEADKLIHLRDGGFALSGCRVIPGECDGTPGPDGIQIPLLLRLSENDVSQLLWSLSIDTLPLHNCTRDRWENLVETPEGNILARGNKGGVSSAFVFNPVNGTLILNKHPVNGFFFDNLWGNWFAVSGFNVLTKYDKDFNKNWHKLYQSSIRMVDIATTEDEGHIIPYWSDSFFGLMKTDCEGNIQNPVACVSGIGEETTNRPLLKLLPNPASGRIQIHVKNTGISMVEFSGIQGNTLLTLGGNAEKMLECVLPNIGKGLYFVKVSLTNGQTLTEKLIVE